MKQLQNIGNARMLRCLFALSILAPIWFGFYVHTVIAEVDGTSYTSPNFDYSITWQSPWYVTEDDTDENDFDVLGLADGRSIVYFSGGHTNASDPAEVIEDYASQFDSASDWSDFQSLDPAQCVADPGDGSAVACFTGNQHFSDSTQTPVGIFMQAWDLGNDIALLLEGYVEQPDFASYLSKWQQFGIYPPGAAVPTTTAAGCDTTVEHDVIFCFDTDLPERDRSDITEAVRLGQDVIAQYFADPDFSGVRVNGFSSESADGPESLATTLDRSVAVYAGSHVWQYIAPVERIQTVVHEFFHIYQNVMVDDQSTDIPLWFTEGTAEAVGYLAATQLGVADQEDFYAMAEYSLTEFPISDSLDALASNGSMTADAYPFAYMAIQYLLGSRGLSISAIGDVYAELADGASFDQAFTTVFDESVDQFTTSFQEWAPTLAKVTDLPTPFWPNDGTAPPAPVALQSVPTHITPDQQIVAVGKTASLAQCEATLQTDANILQRQTFADGDGDVFWLMTIPAEAAAGPATLTISCGSAPVSTELSIT